MTVLYGAAGLHTPLPQAAGRLLLSRMQCGAKAVPAGAAPGFTSEHLEQAGVVLGASGRPLAGVPPGQALTAGAGAVSLVARGRLDNSRQLATELGEGANASDAALILASYQRHGIDCVQHLRGDWAFALWDGDQQRLLLTRDATGTSALFWWHNPEQLVFSTLLSTLLAAGPVPTRPNGRWIAALLTSLDDAKDPTATAFEGVHSLPPGELLLAQHGHIERRRWWRPEDLPPIADTPVDELHAQFVALYDDAVRLRLQHCHGSVAATLSGGLDSGSVLALAVPALAARGELLTAYVHTPRFANGINVPRRTGDEWALAQATAQHVGALQPVACPSEHISPLDGLRQMLQITVAPSHAAGNWYWLLDILQQAAASGAGVLLIGQGGNTTVSYAGSGSLWPALAGGRVTHTWNELRSEHGGWGRALWRRLVKPALRPAWHRLPRMGTQADVWPGWNAVNLLNPEFALALDLPAQLAAMRRETSFVSAQADRFAGWRLGLHRGADNAPALWATLGGALGIDVRDPTRDQRLVEFCWRLPDEVFWSHGRQRGLIRTAMRSALPPQVRDCTAKGLQSADLQARLRHCRDDLLAEIDAVAAHSLVRAWIDVPRLRHSAGVVLGDVPGSAAAVDGQALLRALAAALFVARHGGMRHPAGNR